MSNAYIFEAGSLRPLEWQAERTLRWAAWRPDGAVALAAGNGGSAVLFDGRRTQHLATGTRQNLRGAAWSPDGREALVVGNRGAVLRLRGESVETVPAPTTENLRRAGWHPTGAYALVVGNAGSVLRLDAGSQALQPLPGDRAHTLRSVAFRPDGAYALIGAYASRWAGYPRPHPLYRCDGRFLQALLGTDDEDDFVAMDWSASGRALVCGYSWRSDSTLVNKVILYDGSSWQTQTWPASGVLLGGAWRPGKDEAVLLGEGGLAFRLAGGVLERLTLEVSENLVGPFWRPDGESALVLRGPSERVYTV